MNFKYYAGIGSRNTPSDILTLMTKIATKLESEGYILRSGGADGADQAFEAGVNNPSMKEIYIPWNGYSDKQMLYSIPNKAFEIAESLHKHWDNSSEAVQKLMARNAMQIMGKDLQTRSSFVICWTPDGCISEEDRSYEKNMGTGGTGQAIAHAYRERIAIFNLQRSEHKARLLTML